MPMPATVSHEVINDCWNRIGVQGDRSCSELEQQVHCRNCPVFTGAASLLLDSSAPAGSRAEWTRHYARPKEEAEVDVHSLFIFRLGSEWFALPVALLREVAPLHPVHSLPHRQNGVVQGVTNVRGELLVCLALHQVLGVELSAAAPEKSQFQQRRLIVIEAEGGPLAFPVDEAHGILACPAAALAEVPATLAHAGAVYTHAVLPWQGRSVGCLDRQLLLDVLSRSLT